MVQRVHEAHIHALREHGLAYVTSKSSSEYKVPLVLLICSFFFFFTNPAAELFHLLLSLSLCFAVKACGDFWGLSLLLSQRGQEGDDVGAFLGLLDASERHLRAGHELLWVLQIHVEHLGGPHDAALGVRLRERISGHRSRLAANEAEEIRANAVEATLGAGVALSSASLEESLSAGDVALRKCFAGLWRHRRECEGANLLILFKLPKSSEGYELTKNFE